MKKRILSILLALCMCLTFVPVTVLAEDLSQQDNSISVFRISPPDTGTYYTYKFYNGKNLISEQIVKDGETLLEPQVEPQAGKVFTGWDKEVHFGPVSVPAGENKTFEFHAVFADGYYVTFLTTEGNVLCTVSVKPNETLGKWPAEVENYQPAKQRVTGWKNGSDSFTTGTAVTANVTLTPECVDCYWVTFDTQGGSGVASRYVDSGDSLSLTEVTAPSRSGYTFKGWSKTPNGNIITSVTPKTDTILYAVWDAATAKYTVAYWGENANDDEFGTFLCSETKYATTGASVTGPTTLPDSFTSRAYFTYKESDTATVAADDSTVINVRYTRNTYSVTFNLGNDSGKSMTINGKTYNSGRNAAKYVLTAKFEQNIENLWPTATNFASGSGFSGWSVSGVSGTLTSKRVTMTADLCSRNGKTAEANYDADCLDHLYYMFESFDQTSPENGNDRIKYKGKYYDKSTVYSQDANSTGDDWQQKSITGMKAVGTKTETVNGYYGYWGWHPTERNVFLYYDRLSYDLVLNNYGVTTQENVKYGASLADQNVTPDKPAGFSAKADFKGWYAVPVEQITDTTVPYDFTGKTMPAHNMTLYAYWVEPQITVTLVVNVDGTETPYTASILAGTKAVDCDKYTEATSAITNSGKTLLKWVDVSGNAVDLNQPLYNDTTIYAVFKGDTHQVKYDVAPGTGTVTDNNKYEYDALAVVKSGEGVTPPTGKVFLGWSTTDDGTVDKYPGSTVQVKGEDITLYAVYGNKTPTVSLRYHSNFKPEEIQTVTDLTNNSLVILKDASAFTRTGYTLTGWNTQADGKGDSFALGASARVNNIGSNDLYAQWTPNTDTQYKVEFYYQNADGSYALNHTDSREGTTDAPVSVTETDKAAKEDGKYVYDTAAANVESGTVAADGTLVLKLYFKLNQFQLTIKYVYEDNTVAQSDHSETLTVGDSYSVDSPTIDGYTADQTTVSGTMPARNVEVTVIYSKRTDLSYTVNYYWNDTTEKVAASKTVTGQTFNASVTETPITISGHTPVSNDSETITIGTGQNVINFYYYKNVELTANSETYTYDGTEKSVNGFTGAPAGADFSAITVGAKGTDAGTYDANFAEGTVGTVDATKKYIVTVANNGALVITPVAKVTVTITGKTKSEIYDGTEKTVSGYTVSIDNSLYTENDFTFSGTATATGTDAGKYDMELKASDFQNTNTNFTNVEFVIVDGQLEITKRNVTLTSATASKTYDGNPLTAQTVTVTGDGFAEGEGASYNVTGTITNADTVNNTFTYTLNKGTKADNYNITKVEGKLTIDPIVLEVTVTIEGNTKSETYDGTEKTVSGYEVVSISNELYTEKDFTLKEGVTGTITQINAGNYLMGLAFENISKNFANVKFIVTDGSLEIKQRDVTITGESASKTYNGKVQEITGITVEGLVDGHSLTGLTYSAKGKDVGKYDGTFTGQTVITDASGRIVTDNYNVKTVAGVLTITRPYRPSTPTTPVTSVKTGDMGIALYAMTSLLSLSGAVAIIKKRKEDEK